MSAEIRTWPTDWEERRRGIACPVCLEGRREAITEGDRFYAGSCVDAYLKRRTKARGYALVFWRGRHVADPTELEADEWLTFARELMVVARALESVLSPAKLNVMLLGNSVPHLHAHVVPRYLDDPNPEMPPLFMLEAEPPEWDGEDYRATVQLLRERSSEA